MKKHLLLLCCLICLLLGSQRSLAQAYIVAVPGTHICSGTSVTVHIAYPATGPSRFTWDVNGSVIVSDSVSDATDSFVVSGLHNGDTIRSVYSVVEPGIDTPTGSSYLIFTVDTTLPDPGSISGASSVCVGGNTTLSVTVAGGVWSSSNTSAAIFPTGALYGVTAGTDTISYTVTNACGSASATHEVIINPLADPGIITGPTAVCHGFSITLTDTTTGGTWSSTTGVSVTGGVVSGTTAGLDTVYYTVTNGCGPVTASYPVTVDSTIGAGAIFGAASVCVGSSTTLTDSVSGGVWTSANGNATVSSAVVTGAAAGVDTIYYTVSNACGSSASGFVVSVDTALASLPAITVTGTPTLCVGTTVELHDAVAGGVWSSNNTTRATVNDTGLVSLLSGGGDTIFYSMTNSCGTVSVWHFLDIHHVPVLGPIGPDTAVCLGSSTTLHCTPAGGTWNSSLPIFATISSAGVVDGLLHGVTVISYTYTNACGTASDSIHFGIDIPAQPIIGSDVICQFALGVFFDPVPGGTWSIDNPFAAFPVPGTPGAFLGLFPSTANIIYTLVNACGTTTAEFPVTVEVCPSEVAGVTQAAGSVSVFPNPSSGDIIIDLASPTDELANVTITNMVGATVKELTMHTNSKTAIILAEPAGVYFITAKTANAQYTSKIVLVK